MDEEELNKAINLKSKRELKVLVKTPRQEVLNCITRIGPVNISKIAEILDLDIKKVRYETLRLVQLNQIEMNADAELDEPIFSIVCD